MIRFLRNALTCESGAVTVDWVVLTAATVGLGVATTGAVRSGVISLGGDIGSSLTMADVAGATYFRGAFNPTLMADMVYWQNPADPMHAHWYQEGGHILGWESLHDLNSRLDIMEVRHHPWMEEALGPTGYAFDMIGEPGQHMNIQQPHDIPAGQAATVSFQAANYFNGAMNVYWGNRLVGTYDSVPVNQFQTYTIPVTGGTGDGTNMLRFESTAGDGWRGIYLANVAVN